MIVIFDIDGVLADNSHRLDYALKDKNYDKFYSDEEVTKDTPILAGIELLKSLSIDHDIHFVTGRNERCLGSTANWLMAQKIHPQANCQICIRDEHDYRPSPIVKVELLRDLLKELNAENEIGLFIDDDPENVVAIEKAFPNIKGLVFGAERIGETK